MFNTRNFATAAAIALVSAQVLAQSATETFLSIPINAPFDLPECAHRKTMEKLCFFHDSYAERAYGVNNGPLKGYQVSVPVGKKPSTFLTSDSYIGVRDGQIVSIRTTTLGVTDQEKVLSLLVDKYGAPKTKRTLPLTNGYGATTEVILAAWETPTVMVEFYGATTRLSTGEVTVVTKPEKALRDAEKAAKAAAEPKL